MWGPEANGNTNARACSVKYKRMLEQKEEEIGARLLRREGIAVEKEPDAIDNLALAAERESAVRELDRETALLHDIRAALRRIDDGEYGICLNCGEDINPKRLAAVPWAPLCIRCQEAADGVRRSRPQSEYREMREYLEAA